MESIEKKGYEVKVDDMFHYMDESERYTEGVYDTLEEAIQVCVKLTLASLNHMCSDVDLAEFTPKMLRERWFMFGGDAWITGSGGGVPFSAAEFMTDGLLSAVISSKKTI